MMNEMYQAIAIEELDELAMAMAWGASFEECLALAGVSVDEFFADQVAKIDDLPKGE